MFRFGAGKRGLLFDLRNQLFLLAVKTTPKFPTYFSLEGLVHLLALFRTIHAILLSINGINYNHFYCLDDQIYGMSFERVENE